MQVKQGLQTPGAKAVPCTPQASADICVRGLPRNVWKGGQSRARRNATEPKTSPVPEAGTSPAVMDSTWGPAGNLSPCSNSGTGGSRMERGRSCLSQTPNSTVLPPARLPKVDTCAVAHQTTYVCRCHAYGACQTAPPFRTTDSIPPALRAPRSTLSPTSVAASLSLRRT